jgi:hypothetical protein
MTFCRVRQRPQSPHPSRVPLHHCQNTLLPHSPLACGATRSTGAADRGAMPVIMHGVVIPRSNSIFMRGIWHTHTHTHTYGTPQARCEAKSGRGSSSSRLCRCQQSFTSDLPLRLQPASPRTTWQQPSLVCTSETCPKFPNFRIWCRQSHDRYMYRILYRYRYHAMIGLSAMRFLVSCS